MAHIGVLEVLEELNVPFDAIVGASMGAIAGGMYASGLSPAQMRDELRRIDWPTTFNDDPARKYLPYRRKQEDDVTLFKAEAGFNKDGLSLTSGIVAGQKLNFILRKMLLHSAATQSFDDLPIPFRAIATDLDTGEAVVIARGDLPEAIRASMAFPVLFTPVRVDSIAVEGLHRVPRERILRRIRTRPGDTLDLQALQDDLERIYLVGEFQTVEFRLEPRDGRTQLVISAEEKSWGPWYVRAGLGLETDFDGTGNFLANLLVRRVELNRLGAEWRTLLTIGDREILRSDLYQPLSQAGHWFVGAELLVKRDNNEVLTETTGVLDVDSKVGWLGLDAGRTLGQWGEVRLGAYAGRSKNRIRQSIVLEENADLGAARLRLGVDRLDNPYFPRHGTWAVLTARASRESLGADQEYERVELGLAQAWTSGKNSFVGRLRLGSDLDSDVAFHDDFELGCLFNLTGFIRDELRGTRLGYGALIYFRQLNVPPGPFGTHYYAGASLELGNVWLDGEAADVGSLRPAGSVFVGADTLLGPLYLAWGQAEGSGSTLYFYLGRIF